MQQAGQANGVILEELSNLYRVTMKLFFGGGGGGGLMEGHVTVFIV